MELKCANGKCVPKKSFCDRINDCGDNSDEPPRCSCREYLKLSEPSKICDGIIHCRDSSDERFCLCNRNNFKCERSASQIFVFLFKNFGYNLLIYRSFTCVANATLCDGIYDCPKGEDEKNCIAMKPFKGT